MDRELARERRRALKLLADCPKGCSERAMLEHGFANQFIASLVNDGLAIANAEHISVDGRSSTVRRIQISPVGQRLLPAVRD
jgi:hypothetical protein